MGDENGVADPGIADPGVAVIAHSLISSVSVIAGALQTVIAYDVTLDDDQRSRLLGMALTQATYVGEVLKDMARGLPSEVIEALDSISERRPPPPA